MDFAKSIKKLRLNRLMDQVGFAELIGITPQHLSNIEAGRARPSMDLFLRISENAKVSPLAIIYMAQETAALENLPEELKDELWTFSLKEFDGEGIGWNEKTSD